MSPVSGIQAPGTPATANMHTSWSAGTKCTELLYDFGTSGTMARLLPDNMLPLLVTTKLLKPHFQDWRAKKLLRVPESSLSNRNSPLGLGAFQIFSNI